MLPVPHWLNVPYPVCPDSAFKNIESSQDTVKSTASDIQAEIKPLLISQREFNDLV